MSQNINLYNPAFRKQRQPVTFATVIQCLAITVVALAGYHYYLDQQVKGVDGELKTAESLLKSQVSYVNKIKGQSAGVKPDAALDGEIARLEGELKVARDSVEALKGGALGNQQGFAEYLRAFSRQSVSGLWLTGFTISGGGELEIRGRVLSPDLVPGYIQRLNREQVLAGRSFGRLEMAQPKPEPGPAAKGADTAVRKAEPAPRFLEFSLATTDAARAEKTP